MDDINYKYPHQIKRQTSEHFTLAKKRLLSKLNLQQHSNGYNEPETGSYFASNQQSNQDDLNSQSTNYQLSDLPATTAKNNQIVCYKKYFDLNQTKSSQNLQIDNVDSSKVNLTDQLMNLQQINTVNLNQTSISTQVDEQELYRINSNSLFENGNQATINQSTVNHQSINLFNNNMNTNLINYNETPTNMCNVNTQMPSVPASPINQKDNPFSNQFTNQMSNQMINEKVDFNNNLSSAFSYGDEQQLQLNNNCQINSSLSNQLTNQQLNNQLKQKLFLNPQQTKLVNNRNLNRVRHSSGPSAHPYNSMYNNSFLSNNNLTNIRSNSLSPLYEDQKMANFDVNFNGNNNASMMNKFSFEKNNYTISSNPVSPVSEPMSPNFLIENKKQFTNLRFNKLTNLGPTKKEVSRSASFASSNSNDPLVFTTRTRHRHMSSPYIGTTMLPASGNNLNNYSYSSQSLTNSPTLTPFNSNNELFVSSTNLIDNTVTTNNLNLQETNFASYSTKGTYELMNNKYELPLSPPLSGALNEEKTFKILKREDLVKPSDHLAENQEWNNQQLPILMNMELQTNNNSTIQEFNNNLTPSNSNLINRSIPTNEPVDDLQTTLQDLKDLEYI